MGLNAEIRETVSAWPNSKFSTKILILLSLFLLVSNVASLADQIFQWRGFILDGVEFYRQWIVGPFRRLGKLAGLDYTQVEVDLLAMWSVFTVAYVRMTWRMSRRFASAFMILVLLSFFIHDGITTSAQSHFSEVSILCLLFVFYGLSFTFVWGPEVGLRSSQAALRYFGPLAITLFAIGLLGAINSGLALGY